MRSNHHFPSPAALRTHRGHQDPGRTTEKNAFLILDRPHASCKIGLPRKGRDEEHNRLGNVVASCASIRFRQTCRKLSRFAAPPLSDQTHFVGL